MIKPIDEVLYNQIVKWWEYYKTPAFPIQALKRSYVSFVEDSPICSASVFMDELGFCAWLAFVTMNPDGKTEEREIAFKEIIDFICDSLTKEGVKFIYAPANNPSLLRRYEQYGFDIADLDVVDTCKTL